MSFFTILCSFNHDLFVMFLHHLEKVLNLCILFKSLLFLVVSIVFSFGFAAPTAKTRSWFINSIKTSFIHIAKSSFIITRFKALRGVTLFLSSFEKWFIDCLLVSFRLYIFGLIGTNHTGERRIQSIRMFQRLSSFSFLKYDCLVVSCARLMYEKLLP